MMFSVRFLTSILILITGYGRSNTGVYGYDVSEIADSKNYDLVYDLDIPNNPNFKNGVDYSKTNLPGHESFSRIAYFLELDSALGSQHIWISMNAFTGNVEYTGVPCPSCGQGFFQEDLTNINVDSNVIGSGNGLAGNVEFWPNNYGTGSGGYDESDIKVGHGTYGSMQIHVDDLSGRNRITAFAFNNFNNDVDNRNADIGIGDRPTGHKDWTFSFNAATYTYKNLKVYVCSHDCGVKAEDPVWVPIDGEQFLGCYIDKPDREFQRRYPNHMTVRQCFDKASAEGYKYAGLQDSHECFASNEVGKYGEAPGECAKTCRKDAPLKCGGRRRMSVFILAGYVPKGVCTGPTARWSGDPHFTTFDGLKYDCQGAGEFVVVKAPETSFEVRGRFQYLATGDTRVTVTRGLAFKTSKDQPTIAFTLRDEVGPDVCRLTMYVDGVEMAAVEPVAGVANIYTNRDRTYIYTSTGASLSIFTRNAGRFGCYFSVSVCIPTAVGATEIVGLLGSPTNDKHDDWMVKPGNAVVVTPVGDTHALRFKPAYDWCVDNWCITDPTDSFFTYDDTLGFSGYNHCPLQFDPKIEEKYNAADPKVKEKCNGNPDCILETVNGGDEEARVLAETEVVLDEMVEDPIDAIVKTSTNAPTGVPTIAPTVSPPTPSPNFAPGVKGDPHFKTWAGEPYDFHGVCDLVLIKNNAFENGLGMDIHMRAAKYLSWSYVSTAAIRIGENIFEVIGTLKGNKFWINGVEGRKEEIDSGNKEKTLITTLSGYSVYYKQGSNGQGEFSIDLGEEDTIIIGTWKSYVRVQIDNAKDKHFRDSRGLMGSFSEGIKLARDNITVLEDLNVFGQEWQVRNSEPKLFRVEEGPQHPVKCDIPSSLDIRRRLGESKVTLSDARKACANVNKDEFELCVFDVTITNDESTAGVY